MQVSFPQDVLNLEELTPEQQAQIAKILAPKGQKELKGKAGLLEQGVLTQADPEASSSKEQKVFFFTSVCSPSQSIPPNIEGPEKATNDEKRALAGASR